MNPGEGGEFCSFQRKSRKLTPAGEIDGIALVVLDSQNRNEEYISRLSLEAFGSKGKYYRYLPPAG